MKFFKPYNFILVPLLRGDVGSGYKKKDEKRIEEKGSILLREIEGKKSDAPQVTEKRSERLAHEVPEPLPKSCFFRDVSPVQ